MGIFDKFNKNIDKKEIRKQVDDAKQNGGNGEYKEIPAGTYEGEIEKLELAATKDGRPMLKVMFRIKKGEYKKHCLFMNRVCAGTKNDMNMIASIEGWINKLEPETLVEFNGNYDDFAENIMDAAEDICGVLDIEVNYDPDEFNCIEIVDFWEK